MKEKVKKILCEPLFYLLPLLVALYLAVIPASQEFSDIKVTRNDRTENIELPYLVNDMHGNEVFFISFNLTLKNKTAKLNIIPDDCIQEILINGKKFPLNDIQGICDCEKGAYFDFSEYVQKGMNYFEFKVINSGGGPAGFNIKTYSSVKQFSSIHYIFALFFVISIVLISIKFKPVFIAVKKQLVLPSEFSIKQNKIVFGLIFFLAVALRLWDFGATPAGFNQDELSMAYDSYADLIYGIDRNGDHNAVLAVAYGAGEYMGYNYVLRPFIKLFGFNTITIRLPMIILSIISLFIFYLLLKNFCGVNFALIGFFLLAFNPWHIMLSRWGFGANFAPLIFLIGVYFAMLSHKKPVFFIPAMFFFVYACYSYMTTFIMCAVFIPLIVLYALIRKTIPVKYAILGILTFLLTIAPLLAWMFINVFDLPAFKFLGLAITRVTAMRSASIVSFGIDNFANLGELLFTGQDGLIHNSLPKFGTFYPFMLPFIIFGVYVLFVKYKGKATEMKFWLISAVFLALFINININRINLLFFPLIFLATLGVAEICRIVKFFLPIFAILIIITTIAFANTYFSTFNRDNQHSYFNRYEHAIEYAVQNSQPNSAIYISGVNMPFIFALYATKMPPQKFLNTVVYANQNVEFRHVVRFDRFITGVPHFLNSGETGVFHKNEVNHNMRSQAKKITQFGNFLVVEN